MIPIVRAGTREDIPKAIDLVREFVAESLFEYGMTITEEHALKAFEHFVDHSLVLDLDGAIVGLIAGTFTQNFLADEQIFSEQIWFVSKRHRRYGLKLIEELKKKLFMMGVRKLIMGYMANSKSDKLNKFYESIGFKFMEAHFIINL